MSTGFVSSGHIVSDTVGSMQERIADMLREYVDKLASATRRAYDLRLRYVDVGPASMPYGFRETLREEYAGIKVAFQRTRPGVDNLARHASQLLEQAQLSISAQVELQLRLAELETALEAASKALAANL